MSIELKLKKKKINFFTINLKIDARINNLENFSNFIELKELFKENPIITNNARKMFRTTMDERMKFQDNKQLVAAIGGGLRTRSRGSAIRGF